MPYRIGQLREKAYHRRRRAADIRETATTIDQARERQIFLEQATALEDEAAALEAQAAALQEVALARRRPPAVTSRASRTDGSAAGRRGRSATQ